MSGALKLFQEAELLGQQNRLRSIMDAELAADVVDMDFDGAAGYDQSIRDLPVRQAFGHPLQHLELSLA